MLSSENELDIYDESSWSDLVAWDCNAYVKSKTLSEKFAWDFQANAK